MRLRRLPLPQFPSTGWSTIVTPSGVRALSRSGPSATPRDQGHPRRPLARPDRPSIFQQLFPDQSSQSPNTAKPGQPRPIRGRKPRLPAASQEFRQFLDDTKRAESSPGTTGRGESKSEGADKPAVLLLSCASKSLLESDFFRHAPQGRHVDGWARGLVRVAQARDPHTQDPLGQYYLFFDSRAAALAYMDEVKLLHHLSRARLGKDWRGAPESVLPVSLAAHAAATGVDPGEAGEKTEARARSYALLPPSIPLDLKMLPPDAVLPGGLGGKAQKAASGGGAMPTSESHKVLVVLNGGRIPVRTMQQAIDDDGKDRNLAWRLWRPKESIFPLDARLSRIVYNAAAARGRDGEEREGAGTEEAFERFVVCFAEAVEARRFVRSWHRRSLLDRRRDCEVEVSATVIW